MPTERRKADRAKMAQELADLAIECGASARIEEAWPGGSDPRCTMVYIDGPRGLRVSIDFDGRSAQPDVYVISWNISTDSDAKFANGFAESINPYHWSKATDLAYGFDQLAHIVRKRLKAAADGPAFDAEREARYVAANGTAAERGARWAAYFDGRAA